MQISQAGKEFVKKFTRFFPIASYDKTTRAYRIGYNTFIYQTGVFVRRGQIITEIEAERLLYWHLDQESVVVWRRVADLNLNQNQFDALVSFCSSLNTLEFSESQLLKEVKRDKDSKFIRMCFYMQLGKERAGRLDIRRKAEAVLYFNNAKPGRWGWDHRKKIKEVIST